MISFMGKTAMLIAAFLPGGEPPATPAEPIGLQGQEGRLNSILEEWHRQSASRTALDVRFTRLDRSAPLEDESYNGRVVLDPGGRFFLEFVKIDTPGKPASTERFVRTDRAFHILRPD